MIKVTDCNELENLAEFYIFIWGIKLYSGRMQIQNLKKKSDSNDESRLFYLLSKTFSVKRLFFEKSIRSNDHFSEKTFGQMTFRSNDRCLKKAFGQMNFQSYVISVI
jgi:hypothetical protein